MSCSVDAREHTPFVISRLQRTSPTLFLVTLDGTPQGFAETEETARFYVRALADDLKFRLGVLHPANEFQIDLSLPTVSVLENQKGLIFDSGFQVIHRIAFFSISLLDVNTLKV